MAFDDLDQAEQEEEDRNEQAASTDATASDDGVAEAGEDRADPGETAERGPHTASEPGRTDRGVDGRSSSGSSANTPGPAPGDPAFGFEEAKQRPLYARQEAWDAFEDALAIDVESTLRRNDVRDTPKRELHDAALRVLASHAEEVAERVLEERGIDR